MIEMFNEVPTKNTGIIYNSTFEQIKKLYAVDPEKAGELAISAIELVLTGQMSSDDVMIDMMLTTIKAINDSNAIKYETRVENTKQKKAREMKLYDIADMLRKGYKQREIGERLNLSQQNVSYRVGVIRSQYPELLQDEVTETAQTTYKQEQILQTNLQTAQTNSQKSLQTNNPVYKNTNGTKNENFVSGVSCENAEIEEPTVGSELKKLGFSF